MKRKSHPAAPQPVSSEGVDAARRRIALAVTLAASAQGLAGCGGGEVDAPDASPAAAGKEAADAADAAVAADGSPSAQKATAAAAPEAAAQGAAVSPAAAAEPTALPSWVPAPGNIAVLTQANGGLANRFRDVVAPNFEPFYSKKVVNDYSGAFKNPHWGTWGCTVFFGGGHAATNDNMVAIAEYGASAISFRRICDPTPWFGTGTDEVTRYANSVGNANASLNPTYMESTIDGKPGAPHSYGCGDIIGPEHGGAAHGTFMQVISSAVNYANDAGAVAAHALPLDSMSSTSSERSWRRVTDATAEATFGPWAAPVLTSFVPAQRRIYIVTNGMQVPGWVRWFDTEQKTWVTGTGTGFGYDGADGFDSGALLHVPERNLLLCLYPVKGKLRIQWMDVSKPQPTLGPAVKLSVALSLSMPWSAACWCTHSGRIIVAGVLREKTAMHEIEIPPVLTNTWTVTRAPFGAGQTFVTADPARKAGVTWKKFQYDEKLRAVVYMPLAASEGDDRVWVYRPRFT